MNNQYFNLNSVGTDSPSHPVSRNQVNEANIYLSDSFTNALISEFPEVVSDETNFTLSSLAALNKYVSSGYICFFYDPNNTLLKDSHISKVSVDVLNFKYLIKAISDVGLNPGQEKNFYCACLYSAIVDILLSRKIKSLKEERVWRNQDINVLMKVGLLQMNRQLQLITRGCNVIQIQVVNDGGVLTLPNNTLKARVLWVPSDDGNSPCGNFNEYNANNISSLIRAAVPAVKDLRPAKDDLTL